jgi:hypothetical protein
MEPPAEAPPAEVLYEILRAADIPDTDDNVGRLWFGASIREIEASAPDETPDGRPWCYVRHGLWALREQYAILRVAQRSRPRHVLIDACRSLCERAAAVSEIIDNDLGGDRAVELLLASYSVKTREIAPLLHRLHDAAEPASCS